MPSPTETAASLWRCPPRVPPPLPTTTAAAMLLLMLPPPKTKPRKSSETNTMVQYFYRAPGPGAVTSEELADEEPCHDRNGPVFISRPGTRRSTTPANGHEATSDHTRATTRESTSTTSAKDKTATESAVLDSFPWTRRAILPRRKRRVAGRRLGQTGPQTPGCLLGVVRDTPGPGSS